jgi:hypothetical protein
LHASAKLILTKAQLEGEKLKRLSLERDLEISAELLNVSALYLALIRCGVSVSAFLMMLFLTFEIG